jgi:membrane protease YdiL (CAAX protease family)
MNTSKADPGQSSGLEGVSPEQIIIIALVCEGLLFLIYLVASFFLGRLEAPRWPSVSEVIFGVLLAILLCMFNARLVRVSYAREWSWMTDFIDDMIVPLVSRLGLGDALVISLAAGIGEEFFFRGLLQPYLGIVLTSILFSLAHFAFELKRFYKLAILYFFIGILFGVVYELFQSLWVPLIFHVLYDFLAIIYFRFFFSKQVLSNQHI